MESGSGSGGSPAREMASLRRIATEIPRPEDADDYFSGRGPPMRTYVSFLSRRRRLVLGFWGVMFVAGLAMAPFFMSNTTLTFDAPVDSPSGIADAVLAQHFPRLNKMAAGVVIVRDVHGGSVLGADGKGAALKAFSLAFNKTVYAFQPGKPQIVVEVDGYSSIVQALGAAGESMGRELFISPRGEAAIILVQASSKDSIRYIDFVTWVTDALEPAVHKARAADPSLTLNATQTGLGMFIQESLKGVEDDLAQMDTVAMPIALGVLAYVLRSWRLMVIPVICISASAATSFGVMMFPISHLTEIISFAPSVMMSCTVAMSFDYSLFLLSRYQEEVVQRGAQLEDAVHAMLCCAGHTVLVSGFTLMICWLGLTFFPVTLLSSAGCGKRPFFPLSHFVLENDLFAKTGSGQTHGKKR
jgi:uncharacterized membrane protein YdfJ with MMPL/SSD domain